VLSESSKEKFSFRGVENSFNIQKQICAFLKFLCMRITGMIMKGEKLGVISKQVLFYGDPSNEGNRGSLHYAKHRNEDKANKI